MKIHLFDLCGTLYDANTTFDFLRFLYRTGEIKKVRYNIINNKVARVIFRIIKRSSGKDLYRKMSLKLLAGITKKRLNQLAERYYNEELKYKKIHQVFKVLDSIEGNEKVVVITATIDVIADVVCKYIGRPTEFLSTNLNYADGVCKGTLKDDLLGKKDNFWVGDIESFTTDNFSDYCLLKTAKLARVVASEKDLEIWSTIMKSSSYTVIKK